MKHNNEQEGVKKEAERSRLGPGSSTVNGVGINAFARLSQARAENDSYQ